MDETRFTDRTELTDQDGDTILTTPTAYVRVGMDWDLDDDPLGSAAVEVSEAALVDLNTADPSRVMVEFGDDVVLIMPLSVAERLARLLSNHLNL